LSENKKEQSRGYLHRVYVSLYVIIVALRGWFAVRFEAHFYNSTVLKLVAENALFTTQFENSSAKFSNFIHCVATLGNLK
jgi:hypothetical protein